MEASGHQEWRRPTSRVRGGAGERDPPDLELAVQALEPVRDGRECEHHVAGGALDDLLAAPQRAVARDDDVDVVAQARAPWLLLGAVDGADFQREAVGPRQDAD